MLPISKRLMSSYSMGKETNFSGKSVSVDLARVMAYERPNAVGIGEIFGRRRRLKVTLLDGRNVAVEGDEDTDAFIAAMDSYLSSG